MNKRPIGIDLFAGAGGMSLGFEQAGFEIVAAVEIDPVHACVHKFNFPQCAVIPRSVVGLSGDEIRRIAGIGKSKVDVVFGGAPCQGFSLIGHRAFDDPRNSLVKEFVRIVDEIKPAHFVFENVKGLTVGKHRKFLEEIIEEFQSIGYGIRLPWHVLNAKHYGVPQDRERLILIGARKGLKVPDYPEPITSPAGERNNGLPQGPSCQDALSDLPDAEEYQTLWQSDSVSVRRWPKTSDYANLMRCQTAAGWFSGIRRAWDPLLLTSSIRTDHSEISRRRFSETAQGEIEPISRLFKLPSEGISNTLRAGTDSARGAFTSPRPIHYLRSRCITVREMARLHGYPDWFRFHATKWHGARQIGNSVPPPLARAVASQIFATLGITKPKPSKSIDLGDEILLIMGMNQAASYLNVKVPIGKRDRKSGARKRRQVDIEALRTLGVAHG